MLQAISDMPFPEDWGWMENRKPLWTTLPELTLHSENYFAVAARKGAQDDVNVKRQH